MHHGKACVSWLLEGILHLALYSPRIHADSLTSEIFSCPSGAFCFYHVDGSHCSGVCAPGEDFGGGTGSCEAPKWTLPTAFGVDAIGHVERTVSSSPPSPTIPIRLGSDSHRGDGISQQRSPTVGRRGWCYVDDIQGCCGLQIRPARYRRRVHLRSDHCRAGESRHDGELWEYGFRNRGFRIGGRAGRCSTGPTRGESRHLMIACYLPYSRPSSRCSYQFASSTPTHSPPL
jgi:hypothetical protein